MEDFVDTTQIKEILASDRFHCPSCKSEEIDVRYMNGETKETGWECIACEHEWITTKESRKEV